MQTKKANLIILVLTLLISGCFISFTTCQAQEPEPQLVSVTLSTPANNTVEDDSFNVTFNYTPVTFGVQSNLRAQLVLNGTVIDSASNQTSITNNTANSIKYQFTANGTYLWNIRLANISAAVFAPENFTLTVSVHVADPTPTPAPTATPTSTPAPTAVPTATPTATPTPTPTPTDTGLGTWTIVIIAIGVIVVVGVIAIFFLRRRQQ